MTNPVIGITIKYIPPTNHRGARWSARVASGDRVQARAKIYPWDYSLSLDGNMQSVAIAHAKASGISDATFSKAMPISADTTIILIEV